MVNQITTDNRLSLHIGHHCELIIGGLEQWRKWDMELRFRHPERMLKENLEPGKSMSPRIRMC